MNETTSNSMENNKKTIIDMFKDKVKGKEICLEDKNKNHCGREGHWLERHIGIKHNAKNEPDILGFEMKKYANKISVGDYSASEYAFSNKRQHINSLNSWSNEIKINRSEFFRYFGNPNPKKNNRYSWSGSCVPTYNTWNKNGQNLLIEENNDIVIYYSFEKDKRTDKNDLPEFLKRDTDIVIAIWTSEKMKQHIDNKFNVYGFFICKKIKKLYEKIYFGKPFNFEYFIESIKNKKIIFDSGMVDGNNRNYSTFRGTYVNFWSELITEVFE